MYKQTIITILFALVAVAGQGQEIKKVAATPEDFMEHMALCGYEVYTYDISSLRDSVSGFTCPCPAIATMASRMVMMVFFIFIFIFKSHVRPREMPLICGNAQV